MSWVRRFDITQYYEAAVMDVALLIVSERCETEPREYEGCRYRRKVQRFLVYCTLPCVFLYVCCVFFFFVSYPISRYGECSVSAA